MELETKSQRPGLAEWLHICTLGFIMFFLCDVVSHTSHILQMLWDKILQNLAHMEANSHKIFKSHRIFRPSSSNDILWRNKHKSLCPVYHKLLTLKWRPWLSSQSDFCKNCAEFYWISLKKLPYLTDFSPQLMTCMQFCILTMWVGDHSREMQFLHSSLSV